jgi:hypothetical protein
MGSRSVVVFTVVLLLAASLYSVPAYAQGPASALLREEGWVLLVQDCGPTVDCGLAYLPAISLLVEHLDENGRKCNINEAGIDAGMRLPIDSSRLALKDKATDYLYANVNVVSLSNGLCVASVELSLKRSLSLNRSAPAEKQLALAPVFGATVWNIGGIFTGGPADFGRRVSDAVTDYTKQFLAEWMKANPKQ